MILIIYLCVYKYQEEGKDGGRKRLRFSCVRLYLSYDDGLIVVNHWSWYCYYLIGSAPPISFVDGNVRVRVCCAATPGHGVSLPFIDNVIMLVYKEEREMDQKQREGREGRESIDS